jgi:hypothetical protein|tara:strand:- start:797 stop:1012 length:216 start_codon:yes stop_codon:yes gene_type:complete
MKASERIEEIENKLTNYKELLEALEDMEMIYDNIVDWDDIYKPHHLDMELSQTIHDVTNKIQEIEDKLERI